MKSLFSNHLFILLAAVTIALFAFVTIEETRPRPASPAPVLTPPAAETAPEPEPQDDFAGLPAEALTEEGWQTYRNEEYGFEVKYPRNWKAEELGGPESVSIVYIINGQREASLIVDPNANGRGLWHTPMRESVIVLSGEQVTRRDFLTENNELFASSITFPDYSKNGWLPNVNYIILFSETTGGMEDMEMGGQVARGQAKHFDILDQILSTFRFLE